MKSKLPIIERARKYGYIIWKRANDKQMREFLGDRQNVDLFFCDEYLGVKRIDWKHRRISVGYSRTRNLSAKFSHFIMMFDKKGTLKITCQ